MRFAFTLDLVSFSGDKRNLDPGLETVKPAFDNRGLLSRLRSDFRVIRGVGSVREF